MEICLIRHGRTSANEQKLYCGRTDLPLTASGAAEIERLKGEGVYPDGADIFYTSGFARANQTMEIIYGMAVGGDGHSAGDGVVSGNACGVCGGNTYSGGVRARVVVIADLAEFDFGAFEMKSYEELKIQPAYQRWITDETGGVRCPGGESNGIFTRRVIGAYARVLQETAQAAYRRAAVFCHGGTIVRIMEHLWPGAKNYYEWQPASGRGYALTYVNGIISEYKPL